MVCCYRSIPYASFSAWVFQLFDQKNLLSFARSVFSPYSHLAECSPAATPTDTMGITVPSSTVYVLRIWQAQQPLLSVWVVYFMRSLGFLSRLISEKKEQKWILIVHKSMHEQNAVWAKIAGSHDIGSSKFEYFHIKSVPFLALLDSVSTAHGMGLLSVVCRPSVRRPCRNYLWN